MTFAQLKIYYQERGLELNEKFANSLELLTPDGKYNYIAYLLADENGVSIKAAKYAGADKVDLVEPIPMREAVINAIVHSDFSREIPPVFEIFSDRMVFAKRYIFCC